MLAAEKNGESFMAKEMTNEERARKMGQLIAKAWTDDGFKRKLVADPAVALKAEGFEVSPDVDVRVVENTDKVYYLVLPARPSHELSDEDLENVAGGWGDSACSCACVRGNKF
jgi:nitrile hydratase alpha subunit